jgi:uncharacterized protein YbjT (DUF2867 family)
MIRPLGLGLTYTGIPDVRYAPADWHATEQAIRDSGLQYTIVRHLIYSEWFVNPSLRQSIEAGELTSSSGGGGMNTAFRADLCAPRRGPVIY